MLGLDYTHLLCLNQHFSLVQRHATIYSSLRVCRVCSAVTLFSRVWASTSVSITIEVIITPPRHHLNPKQLTASIPYLPRSISRSRTRSRDHTQHAISPRLETGHRIYPTRRTSRCVHAAGRGVITSGPGICVRGSRFSVRGCLEMVSGEWWGMGECVCGVCVWCDAGLGRWWMVVGCGKYVP